MFMHLRTLCFIGGFVLAVLAAGPAAAAAEEADTDGDGFNDAAEIAAGYSPFNPAPVRLTESDVDEDGLSDFWELEFGTDPFQKDTDGDGFSDWYEIDRGFDPGDAGGGRLEVSLEINRQTQVLSYLVAGKIWREFPVSSGKPSMPTPAGEFRIVNQSLRAWSRAYGLWMPYWLGLGGSGLRPGAIGLHELPVWPGGYREGESHLGRPVSHGCVRLGVGSASYIYERSPVGTKVRIY